MTWAVKVVKDMYEFLVHTAVDLKLILGTGMRLNWTPYAWAATLHCNHYPTEDFDSFVGIVPYIFLDSHRH